MDETSPQNVTKKIEIKKSLSGGGEEGD